VLIFLPAVFNKQRSNSRSNSAHHGLARMNLTAQRSHHQLPPVVKQDGEAALCSTRRSKFFTTLHDNQNTTAVDSAIIHQVQGDLVLAES
jgi:hypothetical protein